MGNSDMTQDTVLRRKEVAETAQLPRWCQWCIEDARQHGETGYSVTLTTNEECESGRHGKALMGRIISCLRNSRK